MKRFLIAILVGLVPQLALSQVVPLDEDTAYTLPVNMLPLVDSNGDIDETIAYNEAGMELYWNFITEGGVYSVTAVTPTTGGVYDWTHVDGGMYSMEIPASGGASANNDTVGTGWWTGKADGVLAFSSPRYSFSVFSTAAENANEVWNNIPPVAEQTGTPPTTSMSPLAMIRWIYDHGGGFRKQVADLTAGEGEIQHYNTSNTKQFERSVSKSGQTTTKDEVRSND